MKAIAHNLGNHQAIVLVENDTLYKTAILINGHYASTLAEDFAGMINNQQCPECGRFGGKHGDIFIKTGQDGFGSVEGHYVNCSHLTVKK